tara:strand:- start:6670 stop:7638 length:969 start_codon:yes stop_codon:yes gene_type:complete
MKQLVIDTDPGVDDALAIMMANAHTNTQIKAITTVAGNVELNHITTNACKLVEALEIDAPVYIGCGQSLLNTEVEDAAGFHGNDGLGDANIPTPSTKFAKGHASEAICSLANKHPDTLDLVALGPLTNIAVALMIDPDLPQKYNSLTIMGGALRAQGNTSNYTSEYNFYRDPEAANMVLSRWPMSTIVDWEISLANPIDSENLSKLFTLKSKHSCFFEKISRKTITHIEELIASKDLGYNVKSSDRAKIFYAPDPLAIAVLLDPNVITKSEQKFVTVETAPGLSRGQSLVDWLGITGKTPNANLITEISTKHFLDLVEKALS